MRYLWVAAIGAAMMGAPAAAKPAPKRVLSPKEFPTTLPSPAPPVIYPSPPPRSYPVAPPPPPPSFYARPARPKGNPGLWVTTSDYPSAALRDEISGVTRFRLIVEADGRVSQCDITQSSGSEILDTATCRLIVRRARFNPAVDEAGNPTVGYFSSAVRWIIPVAMPPEPGTFTENFEVDAAGIRSKCRIVSATGAYEKGPSDCGGGRADSWFETAGKPVQRVTRRFTATIENAPDARPASPPATRQWRSEREIPVAGTRVTEVIVETDGTVSDCRVVKVTGDLAGSFPVGTNDCPKRFERGYAAANGEPVRTLLRMTETTVIAPVGKRH